MEEKVNNVQTSLNQDPSDGRDQENTNKYNT